VLGIRDGLVVVTKKDLVDDDILEMAEEEVREAVQGTFLQDRPILAVSSVTGDGLDELKKAIGDTVSRVEERSRGEVFRLFPDRIFTVEGFGTVVTGSVAGGSIGVDDTAYLLPAGTELRVRRMERHGLETDRVVAGDRASLNLVGLDRDEFERGMVIADRILNDTTMVDARLRLFDHSRSFGLWTKVIFHLGTYEHQARVHVMDRNRLTGGETALVQIHLDPPCVVQYGDRFVIRSTSNDVTLGGGEVIDPAPLHHRRRTEKAVEGMARISERHLPELVSAEVRKRFRALDHEELADALNISPDEVRAVVAEGLPDDVACCEVEGKLCLIVKSEYERLREGVPAVLAAYHRRHPLDERGRTPEELMGRLGIDRQSSSEAVLRHVLGELESAGKIRKEGGTWVHADHRVTIEGELEHQVRFVEGYLESCGMQTPVMNDLLKEAKKAHVKEREVNQVFRYLVDAGKAYHFEGDYVYGRVVDECRTKLLKELVKRGEGMTVAQFRDLVGGNRRICLILLGIYDSERVTRREGDLRVITDRGKEQLE